MLAVRTGAGSIATGSVAGALQSSIHAGVISRVLHFMTHRFYVLFNCCRTRNKFANANSVYICAET
jgi:hypothetical protein